MSETAGQLAAARVPEGFARPGCVICERVAGIDLSRAWRVDADTAFHFPGNRRGRILAVPALHPAEDQGKDRAVLNAWLAGYAGEVASERGLGRYDLIISEAGGHPYAEIVPRRGRRMFRALRRGAHIAR
jgi:hypothetical protein